MSVDKALKYPPIIWKVEQRLCLVRLIDLEDSGGIKLFCGWIVYLQIIGDIAPTNSYALECLGLEWGTLGFCYL